MAGAPGPRGGYVPDTGRDPARAPAVVRNGTRVADLYRIPSEIRHADRERALAVLASRQHGVVATAQLLALGFTRPALTRRVEQGRLHRLRDGVYAVGHTRLGAAGFRWAAVLSGGPGAVSTHQSAAAAWDVLPQRGAIQHITVLPGNGSRSRAGLRVHRTRLTHDDVTLHDGMPLTTLARTLIDLGDHVHAAQVRRAFVRAEQLRLIDVDAIVAALERAGRRRGPAIMRGLLRAYDPRWQQTRSNLELRMLDVVRDAGLPQPEVNAWIAGRWEADLLWRDQRLIVEVDGAAIHALPGARSRDAVRDRALRRLGYRVLRVPERALDAPAAVGARVARALTASLHGGSVPLTGTDPPRDA